MYKLSIISESSGSESESNDKDEMKLDDDEFVVMSYKRSNDSGEQSGSNETLTNSKKIKQNALNESADNHGQSEYNDETNMDNDESDVNSENGSEDEIYEINITDDEEIFNISSDPDAKFKNSKFQKPVCEGSNVTVNQFCLLILMIYNKFKLTWECVKFILLIFAIVLPGGQVPCVNTIRKYYQGSEQYQRYYYCGNCKKKIQSKFCDICQTNERTSTFIICNIEKQITEILERESFHENIITEEPSSIKYSDIQDGDNYKTFLNLLSSRFTFLLSCYSDGLALFTSRVSTIWPIFLNFNQLKFTKRFLPQNTILAGVWIGPEKPKFVYFLSPFYTQFLTLVNGIVIPMKNGIKNTYKFIITNILGDLPAKIDMVNFQHFKGLISCLFCKIVGVTVSTAAVTNNIEENIENESGSKLMSRKKEKRSGHTTIFPSDADCPPRTLNETLEHAKLALESGKAVYGINGPTPLHQVTPDYIKALTVDAMHADFGGWWKKILNLLFGKSFKNLPFSIFKDIKEADKLLLGLKPPNFFHRLPRSFSNNLTHFKTIELKYLLLYYYIPVFKTLLPEDLFNSISKLAEASYILHKNYVTHEEADRCENLLSEFYEEFEEKFGKRFLSPQVHYVGRHMVQTLRRHGSLIGQSCFPLEDLNGIIARGVHGTHSTDLQVYRNFRLLQNLHRKLEMEPKDSVVLEFKNKLDNTYFTKYDELDIDVYAASALQQVENNMDPNPYAYEFKKLVKNNQMYVVEGIEKNSYSSCAYTNQNRFVIITSFIKTCICNNPSCTCSNKKSYAKVVQLNDCGSINNIITYMKIYSEGDKKIIPIEDLKELAVCFKTNTQILCCRRVNNKERE